MLPATKPHRLSLADVLPSSLDSVAGRVNELSLPAVDKVVVLVVDGLGAAPLKARAGHARTLAPALSKSTTISAVFPTTTAAGLATLMTGKYPGEHGLVGYTVLDAANDRVVNQLNGWDDRLDPATWQRRDTVFQTAASEGISCFAMGTERYRHSGFTGAVLRGAEYRSGVTIVDRFEAARQALDETDRAIVYVYAAELDQAAHSHGWQSPLWTNKLEALDAAAGDFVASLGRREGMLVTADHGVLDVPAHSHVLFDEDPALVDGIRFVAGEPRCLQLHFEPDAGTDVRARVLERWRASEGGRSWVASRDEAVAAGWFGPHVDPAVAKRIGDIVVAARKGIVYYDSRTATHQARAMVGQHGSFSPDEMAVPLLRFGAYRA